MGHFGPGAIKLAWFGLAYPCLVLQYVGQAIMVCVRPEGAANTFKNAVPDGMNMPMTVLAVLAAIIASQALITGLFTMFSQAYALNMVPRLKVLHTNPSQQGQVYIPEVNWALCAACIVISVIFKTSANLSNAYGIAVTCCFVITTCLLSVVLRRVWRWRWPAVLLLILPMLTVDVLVCSANLAKLLDNGWIPVLISAALCLVMHTHHWGRNHEEAIFAEEARAEVALMQEVAAEGNAGVGSQRMARPLDLTSVSTVHGLLHVLRSATLARTPTVAVFMTPYAWRVPRTVGTLATMGWLPEAVVLLSLKFEDTPFVYEAGRCTFVAQGEGVFNIVLHFGYAEPVTATRMGIHAALVSVALEKVEEYPMLAPLAEFEEVNQSALSADPVADRVRRRSSSQTVASAGATSPGAAAQVQARSDVEQGHELMQQRRRGATIVLNSLHYAPRPEHGALKRLRIRFYSFIRLNARKAISFFGLEDSYTMEISVVRFL
uniref:Potassium transporter n=1 Tax=Strombidinopsis acuminata TaxID=141414 RepID=A0A7S3WDQ2_9SPIT